jgi:hypothetical protein
VTGTLVRTRTYALVVFYGIFFPDILLAAIGVEIVFVVALTQWVRRPGRPPERGRGAAHGRRDGLRETWTVAVGTFTWYQGQVWRDADTRWRDDLEPTRWPTICPWHDRSHPPSATTVKLDRRRGAIVAGSALGIS